MIKINKKIYITTLLVLTTLIFNVSANENYPNTSIAIVDLNLILSGSKAAKKCHKTI
jgi:Skp family chaperone for outer membrane proteins